MKKTKKNTIYMTESVTETKQKYIILQSIYP